MFELEKLRIKRGTRCNSRKIREKIGYTLNDGIIIDLEGLALIFKGIGTQNIGNDEAFLKLLEDENIPLLQKVVPQAKRMLTGVDFALRNAVLKILEFYISSHPIKYSSYTDLLTTFLPKYSNIKRSVLRILKKFAVKGTQFPIVAVSCIITALYPEQEWKSLKAELSLLRHQKWLSLNNTFKQLLFKFITLAGRVFRYDFGGYCEIIQIFSRWNKNFAVGISKNAADMFKNMLLGYALTGRSFPIRDIATLELYLEYFNSIKGLEGVVKALLCLIMQRTLQDRRKRGRSCHKSIYNRALEIIRSLQKREKFSFINNHKEGFI